MLPLDRDALVGPQREGFLGTREVKAAERLVACRAVGDWATLAG
jgi:hypothetical protein